MESLSEEKRLGIVKDYPMPDTYNYEGFQYFYDIYVVPTKLWEAAFGDTYSLVDPARLTSQGVEFIQVYGFAEPDNYTQNLDLWRYINRNLHKGFELFGEFDLREY